jgi:DNA-binding FadR family transcriptional regulator
VQESIKSYILENQLRPGDGLPPETDLASRLGVSRNSVREAVKGLESLGILETRHGSGLFVGNFSIDPLLDSLPYGLLMDLKDLRDLLEIRIVLESGMIEAALEVMSEEQITDLEQLVEEMRASAEAGQPFLEQDRAFHQKLFEDLENTALLRVIDIFWLACHRAVAYPSMQDRDPMRTYRDHAAICQAVQAGDAVKTRAALYKHHEGIIGRLERAQQEGIAA